MKQRKFLGCMAALIMTFPVDAQVPDWSTGGNNIFGGEWFGADASSTVPLEIRHDADQPIKLFTDGIEQFRLINPQTYTIGSF